MGIQELHGSRDREVADILSAYTDALKRHGSGSPQALEFLRRYSGDSEVFRLLRTARALNALFDEFGRFRERSP